MKPIQESRFEYKGYQCVVLFMPSCHSCGYVGIKRGKYYGKKEGYIPISCHGELTYAAGHLHCQDDKRIWWIGFDCAHHMDGKDLEKGKEYFKDGNEFLRHINVYSEFSCEYEKIWTQEEVETECRNIADQLIELED